MSRWQKLLERMVADRNPVGYRYEEACTILTALGFSLAPHGGTSHRLWRLRIEGGEPVYVGLVESSGTLKPHLVRSMIKQLSSNGLL